MCEDEMTDEMIEKRVDNLEKHMEEVDTELVKVKKSQEAFFSLLFDKFDRLEKKMSKMMKWIYRLLFVIIILLCIIAIKSPQTASQILSTTGMVIKAI